MRRSIRSFNFPLGKPWVFDCRMWGEEFKPCLTGVRNKNRKCRVSPAKRTFFRCLKVKSSLLRANGSEQKVQVWKLGERVESWSPILPFRKKLTLKSRPYVLDLKTIVAPEGGGGWTNKSSKVQMPGGLPGEILKLRIDRRIDQGNPLQCDLENLAKIFYEFYHRFNYNKDWKIKTIVNSDFLTVEKFSNK